VGSFFLILGSSSFWNHAAGLICAYNYLATAISVVNPDSVISGRSCSSSSSWLHKQLCLIRCCIYVYYISTVVHLSESINAAAVDCGLILLTTAMCHVCIAKS
jgi:hypothetical protein